MEKERSTHPTMVIQNYLLEKVDSKSRAVRIKQGYTIWRVPGRSIAWARA